MRRMEDAKKMYEEIPVPEELSGRVLEAVEQAGRRRKKMLFLKKAGRNTAAMAAAAAAAFTIGLNTSVAFAKAAEAIPVIGTAARVLTFRSYETETEDLKISVEVPQIDMIAEELGGLETEINREIQGLCQEYADQAVKRAEEYRRAFLDTGGTLEEWAAHNIKVKVWYEVKTQTDQYLSLVIKGAENWNSAGAEERYYSFDPEKGKQITLENVLGEDYSRYAGEQIRSQMEEKRSEDGAVFFEDGIPEIGADTSFYMNENGSPVIVFEKYEIAPGTMGPQEFEIRIQE